MPIPDTIHPWVAERKGQFRFAAQLNAGDNPEPGKLLVDAARQVEAIGLDAVFLGDHPVWTPDVYLHLAAMAMVRRNCANSPPMPRRVPAVQITTVVA